MRFFIAILMIIFTKWLFGGVAALLMLVFLFFLLERHTSREIENTLKGYEESEEELKENPDHWDVVLEDDEDDIME